MFLGYTDWQETMKAVDGNGYFHNGDLVRAWPEGSIVVSGRLKDPILRGGENLTATETEDVLSLDPAIQEAAVVSMPDPRLGAGVCAFLVLQADSPTPSRGELN